MKALWQIVLAVVVGVAVSQAQTPISVEVGPASGAKADNITVAVDLTTSLVTPDSIVSYQFDLVYDSSVVQLDSAATWASTNSAIPPGVTFSMGVHESASLST